MADAKYGRLFTIEDVQAIVGEFGYVDDESIDAAIERLGLSGRLKFGTDEPLFLLRGQDRLAADPVSRYVQLCLFSLQWSTEPVSEEHVGNASEAYRVFIRWQIEHSNRCKVPD